MALEPGTKFWKLIPWKLQRSKEISASSFVLVSYTMLELPNQNVSMTIGLIFSQKGVNTCKLIVYIIVQAKKREEHVRTLFYYTTISHMLSWCFSLCPQWMWICVNNQVLYGDDGCFLSPSCHWLALRNINWKQCK